MLQMSGGTQKKKSIKLAKCGMTFDLIKSIKVREVRSKRKGNLLVNDD